MTGEAYNSIGRLFEEQPKLDWEPLGDVLHLYRGIIASFPDILTVHKVPWFMALTDCVHTRGVGSVSPNLLTFSFSMFRVLFRNGKNVKSWPGIIKWSRLNWMKWLDAQMLFPMHYSLKSIISTVRGLKTSNKGWRNIWMNKLYFMKRYVLGLFHELLPKQSWYLILDFLFYQIVSTLRDAVAAFEDWWETTTNFYPMETW